MHDIRFTLPVKVTLYSDDFPLLPEHVIPFFGECYSAVLTRVIRLCRELTSLLPVGQSVWIGDADVKITHYPHGIIVEAQSNTAVHAIIMAESDRRGKYLWMLDGYATDKLTPYWSLVKTIAMQQPLVQWEVADINELFEEIWQKELAHITVYKEVTQKDGHDVVLLRDGLNLRSMLIFNLQDAIDKLQREATRSGHDV